MLITSLLSNHERRCSTLFQTSGHDADNFRRYRLRRASNVTTKIRKTEKKPKKEELPWGKFGLIKNSVSQGLLSLTITYLGKKECTRASTCMLLDWQDLASFRWGFVPGWTRVKSFPGEENIVSEQPEICSRTNACSFQDENELVSGEEIASS